MIQHEIMILVNLFDVEHHVVLHHNKMRDIQTIIIQRQTNY